MEHHVGLVHHSGNLLVVRHRTDRKVESGSRDEVSDVLDPARGQVIKNRDVVAAIEQSFREV
jgi:hypothetical protein